ncbi:death on curing protein [Spirochaetota bacterium]|nr:death on curing protein [Spirochaetota bacterium]
MNNINFLEIIEGDTILKDLQAQFKDNSNLVICDKSAFESAILAQKNAYYEEIEECAAGYIRSIVQNHPLIDGNKRFALHVATNFLDINGYRLTATSKTEWGEYIETYVASISSRNSPEAIQTAHRELVLKIKKYMKPR